MGGRQVLKAARAAAAHTMLLTFTIALVLKLHYFSSWSWWFVFSPLWLFHAVVSRGRFSIPTPSHMDVIPWDPFHPIVAMPLLVAFELLLCVYLESSSVNQVAAVNLKVVALPVFLLETIIITENLRMCWLLLLEDKKIRSLHKEFAHDRLEWDVDVLFQLLIHSVTMLAMATILGATVLVVLMITGYTGEVNFWALYFLVSWGQFFAYFVFIFDHQLKRKEGRSSSRTAGYLNREDQNLVRVHIGCHVVIVLIVGFEILLCMYLQGTPARAREIPIPIVFSPLFLLQGVGVLFSTSWLVERIIVLLLHSEANNGRYLVFPSRACDFLECMCHGSRFLGWWSIDDRIREADAQGLVECKSGCNTFGSPPDEVKKMPKKDLIEEVCALLVTINEQIQLTGSSQEEYEKLQEEKILCRICFQRNIGVVLLPCRHRILCRTCGEKCSNCPICRISIVKRVRLYYV